MRIGAVPAPLLVLASLLSLQLGAAVAKQLFPDVGALGVVTLRIGAAAVLLLALTRPRLRGRGRRELALLAVFGLVLAGMNLAFYSALARAPLGVVATIELLGPLAVGVAASRRRLDLVWSGLAVLGVVLLTTSSDSRTVLAGGLAFAALAAVLRGSYVLLSRATGRIATDAGALALALAAGALVVVPVGAVRTGSALLSPEVVLLGLVVAALSSALPYALDLQALRRLTPATFAVLLGLSPAVAAVVGVLVLDESLAGPQWAGIGLVVVAAAAAARTEPSRPAPPAGAAGPG